MRGFSSGPEAWQVRKPYASWFDWEATRHTVAIVHLRPMLTLRFYLLLAGLFVGLCLPSKAATSREDKIGAIPAVERKKLEKEVRLVVDILQNHHYSGKALRQIGNQSLIVSYIDELDPERRFLDESDVAFFNSRFGRSLKTVYLLKGDLQPAFEIFDVFAERLYARLDRIEVRLRHSFDFTVVESYRQDDPRPKNAAEQESRWERILKAQVLQELLAGRTPLAAREAVAESYRELRRRFQAYGADEARNHFLDSIIRSFDPHSGYLSADDSRDFSLAMGDTLAGLGLQLSKVAGVCTVVALTEGGPADVSDQIAPGDIILGLRPKEGKRVNLAGRTLNEIIALMGGEAGSELTLFVQKPEEPVEFAVELARRKLPEQTQRVRGALSVVSSHSNGPVTIGWIDLPAFYGIGNEDSDSATRDVEELVRTMVEQGMAGLVLDLRRNPGGALTEAVGLSSLFLPEGSRVMYASTSGGTLREEKTVGRPFRYDGPLIVLTSARSASASEILAGTLKLHRRAVVVGDTSTFGKGTVQSYIDLSKAVPDPDAIAWGTLKLTIQHYFLPDGQPVQQRGVTSDLVLPEYRPPDFKREADLPGSMPATALSTAEPLILPSGYVPAVTPDTLAALTSTLNQNVTELPEWKLWHDERASVLSDLSRTEWSLEVNDRTRERNERFAVDSALGRRRRELAKSSGFPTQVVQTPAVTEAASAHQAMLRRRLGARADDTTMVVGNSWFAARTPDGAWRSLSFSQFDFDRHLAHADELAAHVTQSGLGAPTTDSLRLALHELSQLQRRNGHGHKALLVRAVVPANPEVAEGALVALLTAMVDRSPDVLAVRPVLDIPLREAQRLAAAWATLAQSGRN